VSHVEVLKNPWNERFLELVSTCKRTLRLMAPYVKDDVVASVLDAKRPAVKVRMATNIKLAYFHQGYSDVGAFRRLLEAGGTLRAVQRLHAKVYIFDNDSAVVTSANLTVGGLSRNYEYGVWISDCAKVAEIRRDFDHAMSAESIGLVNVRTLDEIDEILAKAPPPTRLRLPQPRIAALAPLRMRDAEPLFEANTAAIGDALGGWMLSVFNALTEIDEPEFTLAQVYAFVPRFRRQYPRNHHIEEKIRQQLQQLAKLGLIEFLGGGNYAKLWREQDTSS